MFSDYSDDEESEGESTFDGEHGPLVIMHPLLYVLLLPFDDMLYCVTNDLR